MIVTSHAKTRIKERCGLPKRAIERSAHRALGEGLRQEESAGRLRGYFDYVRRCSKNENSNIRIYGNHVYVFKGETLITVLPLANAHKSAVQKAIGQRTN